MDMIVKRVKYRDDSTLGFFSYGDLEGVTLELPWLDNQCSISCIPEGEYEIQAIESPSLGSCFSVEPVEGRTYIRIHSGNFTSQIEGCLLVGEEFTDMDADGIPDITNSKNTLNKLLEAIGDASVKLIIES